MVERKNWNDRVIQKHSLHLLFYAQILLKLIKAGTKVWERRIILLVVLFPRLDLSLVWAAALSLWGVVPHHRHGQVTIEIVLQRGPLARMTFCGFWCWRNVVIHFSNSRCQHRSTRLCKGRVVHRHHSTSTCNHILELEKSLDYVSSSALAASTYLYLPRIILWLMWRACTGPCWLLF